MTPPAATVAPLQLQLAAAGQRVDWPAVVLDIQRTAWATERTVSDTSSLKAISAACGRGETWAWSLKNVPGTEPRFHDGLLLLGLWVEATGKASEALPLLRDFKR